MEAKKSPERSETRCGIVPILGRTNAGKSTLVNALVGAKVLYVNKESQKGILVGAGWRKIKEIGTKAREELSALLEAPVFLVTRVEVRRDWRKKRPR
ncbi:MAG: KH domain-containing protein [Planctomycetes bacterium]|nr:KH domain-containing protein [Planctomycetota bacterium]